MPLREDREMMSFEDAAATQYRYRTIYTVVLCGPNGERELAGTTSRKSGTGLRAVMRRESVLNRLKETGDIETMTWKQVAGRIEMSNGWSLGFGGTLREEAAAAERKQEARAMEMTIPEVTECEVCGRLGCQVREMFCQATRTEPVRSLGHAGYCPDCQVSFPVGPAERESGRER